MIGEPVAVTRSPRRKPSVVSMAMQRTELSPISCATSITTVRPSRGWTRTACRMLGSLPGGNSTSTTAPITWLTAPSAPVRVPGLSLTFAIPSPYVADERSASAPPTISISSVVIIDCRTLFMYRVSESMSSPAASVAFCIAIIRAECSLALFSSTAW